VNGWSRTYRRRSYSPCSMGPILGPSRAVGSEPSQAWLWSSFDLFLHVHNVSMLRPRVPMLHQPYRRGVCEKRVRNRPFYLLHNCSAMKLLFYYFDAGHSDRTCIDLTSMNWRQSRYPLLDPSPQPTDESMLTKRTSRDTQL
jgi:hypothetical protein